MCGIYPVRCGLCGGPGAVHGVPDGTIQIEKIKTSEEVELLKEIRDLLKKKK